MKKNKLEEVKEKIEAFEITELEKRTEFSVSWHNDVQIACGIPKEDIPSEETAQ
jgi:hypothetical protein